MKGTLITVKEPIFKTGNKISSRLESLGPLFLKDLTIITNLRVDYLMSTK